MIGEKINLKISVEFLRKHLYKNVVPFADPIMQGSAFGGWSVLSSTGTYDDGWQPGHLCYETVRGKRRYNYATARKLDIKPEIAHKYPTEICIDYLAEVMQKITNMGLYPRRARIIMLKAGGKTIWHRDAPDNKYAVRLHIPIVTNTKCIFSTRSETIHMPADGSGYLIGVNTVHQASNKGSEDRYHLIMQVWDTKHISKHFRLTKGNEYMVQIEREAKVFCEKVRGTELKNLPSKSAPVV